MRTSALLFVASLVLGCTTQAAGERCEQESDCNTPDESCKWERNPAEMCPMGESCVCCPNNAGAASSIAACIPRRPVTDAGATDTGTVDTGTVDTGMPDAGTTDMGAPDTGTPDTGTPDAGRPDTGLDAGHAEAGADASAG